MPRPLKPAAPKPSAKPLGRPKSAGSRQQVAPDQNTQSGSPEYDRENARSKTRKPA